MRLDTEWPSYKKQHLQLSFHLSLTLARLCFDGGIPQIPCIGNCLSAARSIPSSSPGLLISDAQPHRCKILCNHGVGVISVMTRAQIPVGAFHESNEDNLSINLIIRHTCI